MIRARVSARASLPRSGPPRRDGNGGETTASVASLIAASPLSRQKPPATLAGCRACDTFVLATVHGERSFIVDTDSSSKCHNFLSMSPGAESFPADHYVDIT